MNLTTDDEKYSDRITLRRFWKDGELVRIDLFDGGWRTASYYDEETALRAADRRDNMDHLDDKHAISLSQSPDENLPRVNLSTDAGTIELVEVRIMAYLHDPLDGSAPALIIDIDNTLDDPQPLRIYRNDALVYDEKPKEATQ